MAKKKVKKVAKKETKIPDGITELVELNRNVGSLDSRVWELEQLVLSQGKRIDRLVDAHCKSKTLKGI